jgi:hypothetical protein
LSPAGVVVTSYTDRAAIVDLDATIVGNRPGGVATMHNASSPERPTVGGNHRGLGAVALDGEVIAMKFLNVEGTHNDVDGTKDEADPTVVA